MSLKVLSGEQITVRLYAIKRLYEIDSTKGEY